MPTSRSVSQKNKQPTVDKRSALLRPLLLVGTVAVLAVVILSLPASLVRRLLPSNVTATDFSGTVWHGSAGSLSWDQRPLGAIEWRLHPGALLRLAVDADLHWVRVGFVVDGELELGTHEVTVRNAAGGGPIEDLHDLGIARAWNGESRFKLGVLQLTFPQGMNGNADVRSVSGDLELENISAAQVADGANLGGYTLHVADPSLAPGADITAELRDSGGPVALHATIRLTADGHTGMLTGMVKAQSDAPPSLRREIDTLAELHARDAEGNIPIDLEFTL
jgi:general secretion pathway protein N